MSEFDGIYGDKTPDQKAPSPAPAVDTAPAGDAKDEMDVTAAERTADRVDPYLRRRRRAKGFLIALAALLAFVFFTHVGGKSGITASGPEAAPQIAQANNAEEAASRAADIVKAAKEYHEAHDSYVGFTPSGTFVASGDTTLVIAFLAGEECYYSGIVPGSDFTVLPDQTKQACTQTAMQQAQEAITAQESVAKQQDREEAAAKLDNAAQAASYYAAHNVVDGAPSFAGLESAVEGVTVDEASASSVTFSTQEGSGLCLRATLTHNGFEDAYEEEC